LKSERTSNTRGDSSTRDNANISGTPTAGTPELVELIYRRDVYHSRDACNSRDVNNNRDPEML
jgi:hypothetical protein